MDGTTSARPQARPIQDARRTTATKLFYGIGSIAFGVKDNGFSVLLLLFYNQVLGLEAGLAGLAIMVALVVDAFADPLIGYLSDHLHSRWGRRHPFMYAAALPVALSYLLLFSPPAGLSHQGLFAYLVVVAITVRFCIACYEIPSSALVAEFTDSYDQRTAYLSFRYFFGWVGGLTMSIIAFAVFLRPTAAYPVGQLNPGGYHNYGIAASIIMLTAILASSVGTHRTIPFLRKPPVTDRGSIGQRFASILSAVRSRPALAALMAGMFAALATGLSFALGPYMMTYFWGLESSQMSILIAANFAAAFVALMLAPRLSSHFDKRPAAIAVAGLLMAISPIPFALRLVGVFPPNGSPAVIPLLLAFGLVTTTLSIIWGVLLTSMLADVVEDNEVRTGQRSEGVFFAANTFIAKCVSGFGVFTSSAILGAAAFPAHARPGMVPDAVLWRLAGAYMGSLLVLLLGAIACVGLYNITRASHLANLEVLAGRRAGAT